MRLIPYAEWSPRLRGASVRTHPIGDTVGVTFHWEGPSMGRFPHSACADKVRAIQRFHVEGRGWADIAYNAVVCPHGYVFEGRGPGVKSAANGDEATNDDWYAVCYLGGVGDGFTDAGKQGFRDAVAWLREKGNAGPRINGHRDHKATACPGPDIYKWLQSGDAEPNSTPTRGKHIDHAIEDLSKARRNARNAARRRALRDLLARLREFPAWRKK